MSAVVNRILLATDGSAEAREAARMATMLAEKLGSELHVAYVESIPSIYGVPEATLYDPEFQESLRGRAQEEARKKAEELTAEIEDSGGRVVGTHSGMGREDAVLVRLAEQIEADLVVVGSRGHGRIKRALVGSVSQSVVRHAHGSVLVVRETGGEGDPLPGRILLAVDGSEEAADARQAAVEISEATGSELHVAYALPTKESPPYTHPLLGERWESSLEKAKHKAREFVDEQAREIEEAGASVKDAHLLFGEPDEEIVKLGEELEASLIVLGSRGLGGVRRALMGSVSDSVVRHAHGPVLVVRARQQAETLSGSSEGRSESLSH